MRTIKEINLEEYAILVNSLRIVEIKSILNIKYSKEILLAKTKMFAFIEIK